MRHSLNKLGAFSCDGSGQFAVIGAITMSMLALSVGFAVNTAQALLIKSSLRDALDAAVTSTARDITTGKIKVADAGVSIDRFLQANSNADFAVGKKFTLTNVTVDKAAHTVEATAVANVQLAFPIFTTKDPRVSSTTAAVYSDKTIEVAMMLDITGSMAGQKIKDLKTAAENAVGVMLDGQDPKNPRIRVAIVPYAEAVNTGKLAGDNVFVELPGGSDLPPLLDEIISVVAPSRPDNCATERKDKDGNADFSDDAPDAERKNKKGKFYLARINRDDRISTDWWGNTTCPKAEIVPLTADKQKLIDTIDDFKASGVTAGGIAAQWGYYMLSPKWRQTIKKADLGDGPAKHDANKVAKVAILMTDGQFNTAFAGVTGTPQMQQGDKARSYAQNICNNMKDDGIQVFTIGFDLDDPSMSKAERDAAKGVLKNCSSKDEGSIKHYFEASTGEELDAAFKEIIKNTERLALTK